MGNSGDSGPVQSVDRAVAILEILARDGEAGVSEVARELGVQNILTASDVEKVVMAFRNGESAAAAHELWRS